MAIAATIRAKLIPGCMDPVRAVIYARVSTDNEGQKESCANQVDLANSYVSRHPNISVVSVYVDDGFSGKNDFSRPQYHEMLSLLSKDGFDLILTKSLSRLNRDEYNSLRLNSMLREHDATVLTLEDEQVHDFEDMNSALLHSIKFAMDANYVRQQSINGRKTHELRCERRELSAKDCSYGYIWNRDSKTISINEKEADVVRRIYDEYVFRNETPASIQRMLQHEGINMCGRSISNILADERYIGNFYINKRTTKLGTGQTKSKRIKLPKKEWVLCARPDLQIVDDEVFEMSQRIHQMRITVYEKPDKAATQARFQGIHLFAGKIFCPVCGKPYQFGYADRKKTIAIYRIKNHSDCTSPINRVEEHDLEEITKQALFKILNQQNDVFNSLEMILAQAVKDSQNSEDDISKLKKQTTSLEKKLDNLIDQLSEGGLTEASKERIKAKINQITEEINQLSRAIRDRESSQLDNSYVTDKLANIRAAIDDLKLFTTIDRERILIYIERINMQVNGDIEIILKSGQTIIKTQDKDFSNGQSAGRLRIHHVLYS